MKRTLKTFLTEKYNKKALWHFTNRVSLNEYIRREYKQIPLNYNIVSAGGDSRELSLTTEIISIHEAVELGNGVRTQPMIIVERKL